MKDKISIIVPIYKVEKYIDKCIESIVCQTYSNLEIILVDDGSPDGCPQICDEYAKKDDRIKVIHKKNGGLSEARNYGIEIATGNYITFVDSDDYVSNDYIEYLYNLSINNMADISIVLPQIFFESDDNVRINKKDECIKKYDSRNALITMLYQREFDTSAWGKLYKKELFDDVRFPVGKLYEDISTVYKTILKSNIVVYSNQRKYFYLKRKDSIMGQTFKERDMDYIYQAENMYDNVKRLNDNELECAARCRLINANFSILKKIGFLNLKDKNLIEIKKNIRKIRKNIILCKKSRVKTKIAILISYLLFW